MSISTNCDGDWAEPQLQISGDSSELRKLGRLLTRLQSSFDVETIQRREEFYPVTIERVKFEVDEDGNGLLSLGVNESLLVIQGTADALARLGQSLLNCFREGVEPGAHFHLDYFEGNQLLDETGAELIFVSTEQGGDNGSRLRSL